MTVRALPEDAKAALPLLALFPAGLTRDTARAILGAASEDALTVLRLHSMAEWREDAGEGRFALPEPARRYAEAPQLQPANALDRYAPAVLEFFHSLVVTANGMIAGGKLQEGRPLLALEQPNLRRFLDWGYDHEQRGDSVSLSALATSSLRNYWMLIDAFQRQDTQDRMHRALEAARRNADQWGEANVLQAIRDVQQFRKENDAALKSYEQALGLFRAVGDRLGEANVLASQGQLALVGGDQAAADDLLDRAIAIYRAIGSPYSIAASTANYGWALHRIEQHERARPYFQRAADLFAVIGMDDRVSKYRRLVEEG